MQPNDLIAPGDVWLVGAGPGDPDLLTRKAEKLIAAADIVFYDALVGPSVLALIPPGVDQVSVGKRSGRHSKAQQSINDLLLAAARAGKRVVRLKGGDPSIFGRSAEEMAHLASDGVRFRICPGITTTYAFAVIIEAYFIVKVSIHLIVAGIRLSTTAISVWYPNSTINSTIIPIT